MPINLHLNNPNLHKAPSGKAPSETAKSDSHNSLDLGYQRTRWSERARPSPSPTKKPLRPDCRAPAPKVLRTSSQFTFWVCHCCFILVLVLTGSLCVDLANLGVPMQTRQSSNSDRSAASTSWVLRLETCTVTPYLSSALRSSQWHSGERYKTRMLHKLCISMCVCVCACVSVYFCVCMCVRNVCLIVEPEHSLKKDTLWTMPWGTVIESPEKRAQGLFTSGTLCSMDCSWVWFRAYCDKHLHSISKTCLF